MAMGLYKILRLRHAEDRRRPKRLGLVVGIKPLASVLHLADAVDWLGTVLILTEQKVDAWVIEFPSQLACRQFAARDEDR